MAQAKALRPRSHPHHEHRQPVHGLQWLRPSPVWRAALACRRGLVTLANASDGTLWSVEEPGVLRHWDNAGGLLSHDHLTELETLWTFGPKAELLAAGSDELAIWDVATRQQIATLEQPSWVTAIAFHPTRRLIATGHDDGESDSGI